ncbi:uncharacterized protein LOC126990088 isoform X2 [Eriocheir sinensis]|nr:uncharacterized protein LOC126990088 isoform X2 [Eriocheir sinensis]XP_050704603.1 uncharacterized protein LOC126990088 isoform X2 [Eriocheir sinensis]
MHIGNLKLCKPKSVSYPRVWIDINLATSSILILCQVESTAQPAHPVLPEEDKEEEEVEEESFETRRRRRGRGRGRLTDRHSIELNGWRLGLPACWTPHTLEQERTPRCQVPAESAS